MAVAEKLLELLEQSRGEFLSGEDIARRLFVSRTAVWKAVCRLRADGYGIEAVQNVGYRLSADCDKLSVAGIKKHLLPHCRRLNINTVDCVGSTNRALRPLGEAGEAEGYVLFAEEQTEGRGRMGRAFFSPPGYGIYLSLLVRPVGLTPARAVRITTLAAVAVCEAVEAVTDEQARIKWVNDVYVRGKKVCGILTEASYDLESNLIDYAVLGIGINVYEPAGGMPEELKGIATFLCGQKKGELKNRLAAEILNRFIWYYDRPEDKDYTKEYKRRCLCIGRDVEVLGAGGGRNATVLDIDDECCLLVRYENGEQAQLSSGEISIRL